MTRAAHAGGGRGHTGRQSIENEGKRPGLHSQSKRGASHLDRRNGAQLRRAVEEDADPAARGQARGVSTQGRGLRVTGKCDNVCVQLESGCTARHSATRCGRGGLQGVCAPPLAGPIALSSTGLWGIAPSIQTLLDLFLLGAVGTQRTILCGEL